MTTEQKYYNDLYSLHDSGELICPESIHDLEKAKNRVAQVLKYFNISIPPKSRVLDVGCGLGYWTEALHQHGFHATGVDISQIGIESAQRRFPGPCYKCGSYPEDIYDSFDLIWAVDLSSINAFDTNVVQVFIKSSLERLNENGTLIIGWHTDFSGDMKLDWAHWDFNTLRKLRKMGNLQGPAIVEARCSSLSSISMYLCRWIEKSVPIFFVLKT